MPLPLVVVFHGAFASPERVRNQFGFDGAADGGAIFAYPGARTGTWELGQSTDLRNFDETIAKAESTYCIDQDRIFAAGMSAGGVFAHWIGCVRNETVRPIAVNSGTDSRFDTNCCKGTVSAVMIHGMEDTTIPFDQGADARDRTLEADGCSKNSVPFDANCVEYPGCSAGLAVRWCPFTGEHVVPPWGGQEAWKFFQSF